MLANFADQGHHRQVRDRDYGASHVTFHTTDRDRPWQTLTDPDLAQVTQMQIADYVERFARGGAEAAEVGARVPSHSSLQFHRFLPTIS